MGHKPPIPERLSPEGKDFLSHCLESDPKIRWTASQLLDHAFVKVCPVAEIALFRVKHSSSPQTFGNLNIAYLCLKGQKSNVLMYQRLVFS